MKYRKHATLLAISATLLAGPSISLAQLGGDPTMPPTGVPTRTMKTLDQVEPRIPLVDGAPGVSLGANGGFTIFESGSYYLVGNIEVATGNGVTIQEENVTLDLGGFTIAATSTAAETGVYITANSRVTVQNGFIQSPATFSSGVTTYGGFKNGINGLATTATLCKNLNIYGAEVGIEGVERVVECFVSAAEEGITAQTVESSSAFSTNSAIRAGKVTDSVGQSNEWHGIFCSNGTVLNSKGISFSSNDFYAGIYGIDAVIKDSYGSGLSEAHGIRGSGSVVSDSRGSTSGDGSGLLLFNSIASSVFGTSANGIGIEGDDSTTVSYSRGVGGGGLIGIQAKLIIESTVGAANTINTL